MASTTTAALRLSEDPWYKAPPDFADSKPGTILSIRTAPGKSSTHFTNSSEAYNILFRTTDSNYKASWAITTLFVPKNSDATCLLSYNIPYNTVDVNGSPSYFQFAAGNIWPTTLSNIEQALSEGWYVSVCDHEGPLAASCDGLVAGHAVLDSVRASLYADTGMSPTTTRTAFWGYSGGAIASGWAAELQPHYAPEILCAGAALGGFPPDVSVVRNSSGGKFAGQTVSLLLGMTTYSPAAREEVVSHLLPDKKEAFLAARNYDVATLFSTFANQDIFSYFSIGRDILDLPHLSTVLKRKGRPGHHGVPEMPLFIYHSIKDEISGIELTDALVEKYRWMGANVLYERNEVGDHLAEAANRQKDAVEWLRKAFRGEVQKEGVTVRDVRIEVDGKETGDPKH